MDKHEIIHIKISYLWKSVLGHGNSVDCVTDIRRPQYIIGQVKFKEHRVFDTEIHPKKTHS